MIYTRTVFALEHWTSSPIWLLLRFYFDFPALEFIDTDGVAHSRGFD